MFASISHAHSNDPQFKQRFWSAVDRCWRKCIQPHDMEKLYDVLLCLFSVTVPTFPLDLEVFERLHTKATKHHKYKYLKAMTTTNDDIQTPRKVATYQNSLNIAVSPVEGADAASSRPPSRAASQVRPSPRSSPRMSPFTSQDDAATAKPLLFTSLSLSGALLHTEDDNRQQNDNLSNTYPSNYRVEIVRPVSASDSPTQRRARPRSAASFTYNDTDSETNVVAATGKQLTRNMVLHGKSTAENLEIYYAQPVGDEVMTLHEQGHVSVQNDSQTPRKEPSRTDSSLSSQLNRDSGAQLTATSKLSEDDTLRRTGNTGPSFWLPYEAPTTPHSAATQRQQQQTPRTLGIPTSGPIQRSVSPGPLALIDEDSTGLYGPRETSTGNHDSEGTRSPLPSLFASLSVNPPELNPNAYHAPVLALPITPRKTGLPVLGGTTPRSTATTPRKSASNLYNGDKVRADQYIDSVHFASLDLDDLGELNDSQLPTAQQHKLAIQIHSATGRNNDVEQSFDGGYSEKPRGSILRVHSTPRTSIDGSNNNNSSGAASATSPVAVSALTSRTGAVSGLTSVRGAGENLISMGEHKIADLNDTRTITARNKIIHNRDSAGRMYDIAKGNLLERPALQWGQGLLLKIVNVQVNDKDNFVTPHVTMYVCDAQGKVIGDKQDTHGPRLRKDGRLHYNCFMWMQKSLSSFHDDESIVLELNHFKGNEKGGYISTKQWTMITLPLLVRIKNGGVVSLPIYAKPVNIKKPKPIAGMNMMVEFLTEDKLQI